MAVSHSFYSLPSLLDRLTHEKGAGNSGPIAISPEEYLKSVKRDLEWLLRTEVTDPALQILQQSEPVNPAEDVDVTVDEPTPPPLLADYPVAARSVLSYGIPAQVGGFQSAEAGSKLAEAIQRALVNHEKRICGGRVKVNLLTSDPEDKGMKYGFSIEAHIKVHPIDDRLTLKAYYLPAMSQWQLES